jgi:serine O-acetyltransferase
MSIIHVIRNDFERHGSRLNEPTFWTLAAYRLGVGAATLPAGPWRRLSTAASGALGFVIELATHAKISPGAHVGEDLHLIHAMSVSIAEGVTIGDRVGIMHQVTIGSSPDRPGAPTIGNDVFIGVGAAILGPVTIGDGASIAANSLVISDVPAGAFAIGVPAKAVRWNGGARAVEERRTALAEIV